jgi:hypothetical protein
MNDATTMAAKAAATLKVLCVIGSRVEETCAGFDSIKGCTV